MAGGKKMRLAKDFRDLLRAFAGHEVRFLVVGAYALAASSPLLGIAALVIAAGALLGGLLSLVGDYVQRVYQLGQGIPFYQLREEEAPADAPPRVP